MATYWVDPTSGDNANSGADSANAWERLAYANTQVSTGDTIKIVSGTHLMPISEFSEFVQPVTYEGELDANKRLNTILDFQGVVDTQNRPHGTAGSMILKNLILKNVNSTDRTIFNLAGLWLLQNDFNITYENVIFRNFAWGESNTTTSLNGIRCGIWNASSANGTLTFLRSEIQNPTRITGSVRASIITLGLTQDVSVVADGLVIDYTPSSYGLQVNNFTSSADTSTISGNYSITLRNSIMYSTSGSITITQHIFNVTGSVVLDIDGTNCLFGTYTVDTATTGTLASAKTDDPKFTDPANNNYELQIDSPYKNAGAQV